jgi:ferredoxin-NADP reductase
MERTAVRRRLTWQIGTVIAVRQETPTARTLMLEVPDWPGHLAGQHLDVRLTAPDGYRAARSYSLASNWTGGAVEITVDELPDGEVSPYLVEIVKAGDQLEIRGPVGGWFVWRPEQPEPVQLIAGGSGVVPLRAILRAHRDAGSMSWIRLLYSVRRPSAIFYADELRALAAEGTAEVTYVYTREGPPGERRIGRIDADLLAAAVIPAVELPTTYVCGPTPFVETTADLLVAAGHDPAHIKTERFGSTGGSR